VSAHDETIIGELRRCRANLREPAPADRAAWTMKLTMEEVDALLRAVDERDELRRQTVGDLETGINPVRVETMSLGDHGIATVPERFQPATRYPSEHTITSCPHAGTHHSCPLGGCPTKEPRTIAIPDLPDPHAEHEHCDATLGCIPKIDKLAEGGIVTGASFATGAAALAATHAGLVNAAAEREDDLGREARETPPRAWRRLDDPDMAERVARVYLDPKNRDGIPANRRRPTQRVADELGMSIRTASRWVTLGRKLNLIPHIHASDEAHDVAFYALAEPTA